MDSGEDKVAEPVTLDVAGGVAKLVLNRPEFGNAINEALGDAFRGAIELIAQDRSVRAVLLTGAGKMFCVGGDIGMLGDTGEGLSSHMQRTVRPMHDALLKLCHLPVPVVCAMNGPAGGGGVGMALCADIVLAAESMKIRTGYSGIGLTPDFGVSWFLTRLLGPVRTKEILFVNRPLDAHECLGLGIVNAVYPDADLVVEAEALVRRLAEGATGALAATKRLVESAMTVSLGEQLTLERAHIIAASAARDGQEGVRAFLEKRRPVFVGRESID